MAPYKFVNFLSWQGLSESDLSQRDVGLLLKIGNGASVSKQIKNISDILASNQEVKETHKNIRKLLKLKERTDPQEISKTLEYS